MVSTAVSTKKGKEIAAGELLEDGYNDIEIVDREIYEALVNDDYIERVAIQHGELSNEEFYPAANETLRAEIERRDTEAARQPSTGDTEAARQPSTGETGEIDSNNSEICRETRAEGERKPEPEVTLSDGDQEKLFATSPTFSKKIQPDTYATTDDLELTPGQGEQGDMFASDGLTTNRSAALFFR